MLAGALPQSAKHYRVQDALYVGQHPGTNIKSKQQCDAIDTEPNRDKPIPAKRPRYKTKHDNNHVRQDYSDSILN